MNGPLELVLSRLDGPRSNGPGRWRAACPVCGERNRSTLSVGAGDSGAVLVRCFKSGCDPAAIAAAIGLDLSDLFPPKPEPGDGAAPMKRRRLLTAGQALDLLADEVALVFICASDMAKGESLEEATKDRLLQAAARVLMLRDEAHA